MSVTQAFVEHVTDVVSFQLMDLNYPLYEDVTLMDTIAGEDIHSMDPSLRASMHESAAMVDAFAVQGAPDEIGPRVMARYGDLVQRISFDTSAQLDAASVASVLAGFPR